MLFCMGCSDSYEKLNEDMCQQVEDRNTVLRDLLARRITKGEAISRLKEINERTAELDERGEALDEKHVGENDERSKGFTEEESDKFWKLMKETDRLVQEAAGAGMWNPELDDALNNY